VKDHIMYFINCVLELMNFCEVCRSSCYVSLSCYIIAGFAVSFESFGIRN
jgi:hypothetical protein